VDLDCLAPTDYFRLLLPPLGVHARGFRFFLIRGIKLRNLNWQGALKGKGVKQTRI